MRPLRLDALPSAPLVVRTFTLWFADELRDNRLILHRYSILRQPGLTHEVEPSGILSCGWIQALWLNPGTLLRAAIGGDVVSF